MTKLQSGRTRNTLHREVSVYVFFEDTEDVSVDDRPNSNLEAGRHRRDAIATSIARHTVSIKMNKFVAKVCLCKTT